MRKMFFALAVVALMGAAACSEGGNPITGPNTQGQDTTHNNGGQQGSSFVWRYVNTNVTSDTAVYVNGQLMQSSTGAVLSPYPDSLCFVGELGGWTTCQYKAKLVNGQTGLYRLSASQFDGKVGFSRNQFKVVKNGVEYWDQFASRTDQPGVCGVDNGWLLGVNLTSDHKIQFTCSGTPVGSTIGITLSTSSLNLNVGQTQQLTATVTGTDNKTVVWSSSNSSVATVSSTGLVTGVGAGSATIAAILQVDATKFASLGATVTATTGTCNMSLSPSTASVAIGGKQGFGVNSSNCNASGITWASNNTNVATVDQTGTATGVAAGTATITATLGSTTATATLTVQQNSTTTCSVNSVTPANPTITTLNATVQLSVSTTNCGAVTWTSSNTSVATVSSSGLVTGLANGSATITASSSNSSASTTVTINTSGGSSGGSTANLTDFITLRNATTTGGSIVLKSAATRINTDGTKTTAATLYFVGDWPGWDQLNPNYTATRITDPNGNAGLAVGDYQFPLPASFPRDRKVCFNYRDPQGNYLQVTSLLQQMPSAQRTNNTCNDGGSFVIYWQTGGVPVLAVKP